MKTIDQFLDEIRKASANTSQLGTKFEKFVKKFVLTAPGFKERYTEAWLFAECPFMKGHDIGIDVVAKDKFGDYTAIQCKCYAEGTQVDKADIDTFLSASGKSFAPDGKSIFFKHRVIFVTNEGNWTSNAEAAIKNQQIPVSRVSLSDIRDLVPDVDAFLASGKPAKEKRDLKDHQKEALNDVHKGFEKSDRGQLIMACGTGKTFTSLRIAEDLCPENGKVLFLVPSIALLGQTLREWCRFSKKPLMPFGVCSDAKATDRPDEMSAEDLGFPATTSSKQLCEYAKFLKKNPPPGLTVVFSTYQSISAVHEAQEAGAFGTFDLIICDEAHRTTGAIFTENGKKVESEFVRVHDAKFIKGKKRLYMTATPRVYGDNAKTKAGEDGLIELCSMDDEAKYGPEFHHLSFSAAVKKDLLTDYKVLILAIDEADMKAMDLKDRDGDGEIDSVDELAKIIGTWKGLNKQLLEKDEQFLGNDREPMHSAVAFSSTIAASKAFTAQFNAVVQEHFGEDEKLRPVEIDHVDGGMNAAYRADRIDWLKARAPEGGCRILSNAKCLSEGVDVPGLDAVIFLSPRNSFVEVVQAIGRVMRKAPDKQTGYVIIPLLIPEGMDASDALSNNKRFKVIWDVLAAIRSHDEAFNALDNKVDIVRIKPPKKSKKKDKGVVPGTGDDPDQTAEGGDELVDGFIPDLSIDDERFSEYKNAIKAKLAKVCGEHKYWSVWASEIAEIVQTQIKRITAILKKPGNEYRKEFEKFHETLKANLNNTIKEDEAISMLAQQLVSTPIFDALFADYQFIHNNPISKSLEKILAHLNENIDKKDRETLDRFYESVRHKASDKTTAAQKQQIIVQLYNNFFNIAFKDTVEKLGIVYTPVPVVDFIIKSVECILKKHFKASLSEKGVHVIDPFTGTGTFITRLLQSGIIQQKDLLYKYTHEIHANEIVLLAYYIAAINIESAFHDLQKDGQYHPFDGIVLTDTFQLGENAKDIPGIFPENSKRAHDQKKLDIRVVIANPPYSEGQKSANDNNQNVSYPELERRMSATYGQGGSSKLKKGLYNSYIKAFRWSSDRIKDEGVVGFISGAGWLDGNAMDGFRSSLVNEFSDIYVFDLRGNCHLQGLARQREGGNIFGEGSRSWIAITILVKSKNKKGPGTIHYHDIGDFLSRETKLKLIEEFGDISNIPWQTITPNEHGDWINQRNDEFANYIPLAPESKGDDLAQSFFTTYSLGCSTNRDPWVYGFSRKAVLKNVKGMIDFYNDEVDRTKGKKDKVNRDPAKMAWTVNALKNLERRRLLSFYPDRCVAAMYRPFNRQWLYYDRDWNERPAMWNELFPEEGKDNLVICVNGAGSSKVSAFIVDQIPSLDLVEKTQCFPLYYYEEIKKDDNAPCLEGFEEEGGWVQHDAISDFILTQFRMKCGPSVQKRDIFYYVYGALHDPDYREKFASDLKKGLPRLPVPSKRKDFDRIREIGEKLARLHLNYETVEPWPTVEEIVKGSLKVDKIAFGKDGKTERKDLLVINSETTLGGIPAEAHEYSINGRTPLEWLIERYRVMTDQATGIVNDPNKWCEEQEDPEYIVNLAKRLVRVSVESAKLIKELSGKKAKGVASKGNGTAPLRSPSFTPPHEWKSCAVGVESELPKGGTLTLGLKFKWYDKIESGQKKIEYRELSDYYHSRLGGAKGKELKSVTFMRGQASPVKMTWEVLCVKKSAGCYCIHLGKRLK